MTNKIKNIYESNHTFLAFLFFVGIMHWTAFFLLVTPEGGDRYLIKMFSDISQLFEHREFYVLDQFHDISYLKIFKEALITQTMPFHVPDLGQMNRVANRFLGSTTYISTPQVVLLYWLEAHTFIIVNHLLMFSIGFYGCILLRQHFQLGRIAFSFLFILFNFNGAFVARITAYGSWELGYYFLPYIILLILRATDLKPSESRNQIRFGVLTGIYLGLLMHQGTINMFIHWITFILIWGLVNYKLWKFAFSSIFVAFSVGFVRLVLLVLTFGSSWGSESFGYSTPEQYVQAFVGFRNAFFGVDSYSGEYWHEISAYVSLPGFLMLAYFGLWVSSLKDDWRLFRGWKPIILPCVLIFVMTIRNFKMFIIPQWVPFLGAERLTSRYMTLLLIIIITISAINLHGFVQKYSKQMRIRFLLVSLITVIAGFLFNNSRVWRLHYVEKMNDLFRSQHAEDIIGGVSLEELNEKHYSLVLHIQNNPEDILYMSLVWIGIVGSCLSLLFYSWWLWKNRKEGSFYKT
jgi:hypothetical protein